jgi:hypothetical protein
MSKKVRIRRRDQPFSLGGNEKSLPAYYEGQDWSGAPDHFVSRADAEKMKSEGDAFTIHRGKAIAIRRTRMPAAGCEKPEPKKTGWAVVNQTAKPYHRSSHETGRVRVGPGFPRYSLV